VSPLNVARWNEVVLPLNVAPRKNIFEEHAAEVVIVARPVDRSLRLEVCADDPHDGLAYFAVVLADPLVHLFFDACCGWFRRSCRRGNQLCAVAVALLGVVWEAEVAAEHIDALLAAGELRTLIGDNGHRVDPGEANRGVRVTQLGGGGAESLTNRPCSRSLCRRYATTRATAPPTPATTVNAVLSTSIGAARSPCLMPTAPPIA